MKSRTRVGSFFAAVAVAAGMGVVSVANPASASPIDESAVQMWAVWSYQKCLMGKGCTDYLATTLATASASTQIITGVAAANVRLQKVLGEDWVLAVKWS